MRSTTPATYNDTIKIVTFAASSSRDSINGKLVAHAADLLSARDPQVEVQLLDLNDFEMPIYSIDREQADGVHERASAFYEIIGAADGVLVSFAEHNGSYTAAWKNVYDWASRVHAKVWQGKPTVMLSTAPGPGGGGSVLQSATTAAPFQGAQLVGSLRVPTFEASFDAVEGRLRDQALAQELHDLLDGLLANATAPMLKAA